MKLTLPAGAFDHVAKTVDLSSLPGTWNVNHLLAIVDDTLNVFLYVKGISTLGLSSFATSTVTLNSVPVGAANGDTLTVFYDVIGAVTMAQSTSVTIASDQTAIPVSGTFTLPAGAATASLQTAGNSSLSAIATTLATQSAFTSSLWTDNSGAYYYSMITFNSGTNTFTVTWTTTGGASSSGPGAGAKPVYVAQTVSEPVYYVATASVGGSYTIGDILCHVLITNPNVSPATTTGLWVNTTTTAIISAPAGGNILAQLQDISVTSSVLPTGASTSALQTTGNAALTTINTTLGTPAQDGTDGTGITAPTGGVGIRGWLSGIYSKISTLVSTGIGRTWTLASGSDSVNVGNFPATQPISAAALPLPAGAATSSLQSTANTSLANLDVALSTRLKPADTLAGVTTVGAVTGITNPVAITAASLPLPTGAATAAKQPAIGTAGTASADVLTIQGIASMTALKVDGSAVTQPVSGTFWQATQPISAASLPLPTGAATSANQATEITSLSTIATNSGLAATAAAQTTGNNSLATIVTQTTTSATAAGAPADSAANNSTSSWSIIALLKGLYSLLANVLKVGIYSVNGSTQAVLEPFQNIRVTNEGTPIYTDDFNGAALDANAWTTVLAGTGTATVSGGTLVLATGTTASNAAAISSTFSINSTGISAQKYRFCLQIEASTIAASDRFWGIGTPPVSFTSTTPIQDGIGFELQNGTLYAVVWNAGTRTKATALTVPTDGAYHSYTLQCKSNTYAWQIDSEDTSVATAAFVFPATTALPVRLHQINGASPPGTGPTFRVMSVAFNDISESNHTISDGVYGFRKMQVGANNAAFVQVAASATGGWSSWSAVGGTGTALLLATATAVKASSGVVKSFSLYNASNKIAYLQIFDLATGSVTVGTTVPKESYPVPVGGYYDKDFGDAGLAFATAITICATTTSTGLTAPATGLNVNVEYK